MSSLLERIRKPEDLKALDIQELEALCAELRQEIIATVSKNGGHLSPNLGTVELSVALERVFCEENDSVLWDVGHQAYAHKLLTGRRESFSSLRRYQGLSGFLSPEESPCDKFYTGHAGVVISEAIGLAKANTVAGKKNAAVVAVIGDGSLGCGIALEALNFVRETNENFILVINDNKMAISRSIGAFSKYLNRVITGRRYNRLKTSLKAGLRNFPFGRRMIQIIRKLERVTKSFFVSGAVFEELGMKYVGPIDGHDLPQLLDKFQRVREISGRAIVVHVLTEKGHGCKYASEQPEAFHGCGPFDPADGTFLSKSRASVFSDDFSNALVELGKAKDDIVAITAAMASGTRLCEFRKYFPERFFDVGIAEEHAIVFASGLAAGGLRPVIAIYATFLQRALDCVFHDICLQNLPVIIGVDRSGVVEDGPTHHGIYDLPFLLSMPNLQIYLPCDGQELQEMLFAAYQEKCPVVIRYPKSESSVLSFERERFIPGKALELRSGSDVALWCAGRECQTGLKTAELLASYGISASVVNPRSLKPFDVEKLRSDARSKVIVTIEDSQKNGGFAGLTDSLLINHSCSGILHFGWDSDCFIPHGKTADLRKMQHITPQDIAEEINGFLKQHDIPASGAGDLIG